MSLLYNHLHVCIDRTLSGTEWIYFVFSKTRFSKCLKQFCSMLQLCTATNVWTSMISCYIHSGMNIAYNIAGNFQGKVLWILRFESLQKCSPQSFGVCRTNLWLVSSNLGKFSSWNFHFLRIHEGFLPQKLTTIQCIYAHMDPAIPIDNWINPNVQPISGSTSPNTQSGYITRTIGSPWVEPDGTVFTILGGIPLWCYVVAILYSVQGTV